MWGGGFWGERKHNFKFLIPESWEESMFGCPMPVRTRMPLCAGWLHLKQISEMTN